MYDMCYYLLKNCDYLTREVLRWHWGSYNSPCDTQEKHEVQWGWHLGDNLHYKHNFLKLKSMKQHSRQTDSVIQGLKVWMCVIFWRFSGVAMKKVVQKLNYIKTTHGHEVYYVGNRETLIIIHAGHEWSDMSN